MDPKVPKSSRKREKSPGKKLKALNAMSMASTGLTYEEIGQELHMSTAGVKKLLNSDETKKLLATAENEIKHLVMEAIGAVSDSLNITTDSSNRLKAALSVLKNFGLLKDSVDVNHRFPKPLVIERKDGEEYVLGTTADLKEEG